MIALRLSQSGVGAYADIMAMGGLEVYMLWRSMEVDGEVKAMQDTLSARNMPKSKK